MNERSFTINNMISLIIVSVEIRITKVAIFTTANLVHFGPAIRKLQLLSVSLAQ